MAIKTWNNLSGSYVVDGNWNASGNWSPSGVPGTQLSLFDDVVLDFSNGQPATAADPVFGPNYTVTIGAGETYTIASLSFVADIGNIALTLNAGATLNSGSFSATSSGSGSYVYVNEYSATINIAGLASFGDWGSNPTIWELGGGSTATFGGQISGTGINFDFQDAAQNEVILNNAGTSFTGLITNFGAGSVLDFKSLAYGSGGFTATYDSTQYILNVSQGSTQVYHFNQFFFANGQTVSDLQFVTDGSTGTLITICFAAGTRIATDRGEVAVEDLQPEDQVVTLEAGARVLRPVRWIGRRHLNLLRHPDATLAAPVRIVADAFAPGVPHRDLLVSPDHAILVESHGESRLVPARLLINQMTIRQETGLASVGYFHVELDRHSILLAEGLASESYLDAGYRGFFSNAEVPQILHPDMAADESARAASGPCVPFLTDAASVQPIWQALRDRAVAAGLTISQAAITEEPELRVVAGGREFRPVTVEAGHYVFALPAGIDSVRLMSRSAKPSDSHPWLDDRRSLGVAVERIAMRALDGMVELPMDHPGLSQGWWSVERSGNRMTRWTNGDAMIPLAGGSVLLEVTVAGTTFYNVPAAVAESRQAA